MTSAKACALKCALASLCLLSRAAFATDWLTFAHDPQRSGWAFEEDILSPENVAGLELKWKVQVKNEPRSLTALTAPVVATDVNTPQGVKTLVYVAGSSNHIFALNAENGDIIWTRTFETYATPKNPDHWLCPQGINATPTIDRNTETIYTLAVDGRLYGLDLGTGNIKFGPIQFVPPFSKNWSLNLVNGVIYTSLSQGCGGAQSGVYSLEIRDRNHPVIRNLLISRRGGAGVWGRGGPVVGKNNRIYAAAGDGDFDPPAGEFGSSIVAVSLPTVELLDYFTPTNWRDINKYDLDMGSASPVWFAHKNFNLLASGGKEGVVYLMDAESLGDKDHQTPLFITPRLANDENTFEGKGIWGGLSTWRDEQNQTWVYVPIWGPVSKNAPKFPKTNGSPLHGSIMAFKVSLDSASKKPFLEPAWIAGDFNLPEPVIIANGVLFALSTGENARQTEQGGVIHPNLKLLTDTERRENTTNAVFYALDAKTGKVLFESGNAMSSWVHFSGLALSNGRIYTVAHDSRVYCFGLKGK